MVVPLGRRKDTITHSHIFRQKLVSIHVLWCGHGFQGHEIHMGRSGADTSIPSLHFPQLPPALTALRLAIRRSRTRWKRDLHVIEKLLRSGREEIQSQRSSHSWPWHPSLFCSVSVFSPSSPSVCSVPPASCPGHAVTELAVPAPFSSLQPSSLEGS